MSKIPQQLIGQSPAWLATLDRISVLAALDKPILVVGERGTGKALCAQRLHFLSSRWEGPFRRVNVAEYDSDTLASLLFGGQSGFGNPDESLLEQLSGGTLCLDQAQELAPSVQAKLARLIETGEMASEHGDDKIELDVRFLITTDQDIDGLVREGRFNANLAEELAFEVLTLPPLRERRGDSELLAIHFATKMARSLGADHFAGLTPEAVRALAEQNWPGNIRELKTVIERSVARLWNAELDLGKNPVSSLALNPYDSPWRLSSTPGPHVNTSAQELTPIKRGEQNQTTQMDVQTPSPEAGFAARTKAFERSLIDEALRIAKNHQGKAAEYLGLSYHQFRGLLRKHGLKR